MSQYLNSVTVDVEEYFHAANLEPVAPPATWHRQISRVECATDQLLEIFADYGVSGTFFVLGATARRHPGLVQRIAAAGHEIASHGYGHRLVRTQNIRSFYRDVRRTKYLLEQITSAPVIGYRAPNFSIRSDTAWAYEELVRAGYVYDSSLHPIRHARYGNIERRIHPEIIETPAGPLIEMPLAVSPVSLLGRQFRFPCSGGAYWRLFPLFLILAGLNNAKRNGVTLVNYLHPWEVDSKQPRFETLSRFTQLRHYGGTNRMPTVLATVLKRYGSVPLSKLVRQRFPQAELPSGVGAP